MNELKDWLTLIFIIFIATLAMQTLSTFLQKVLKLDRTEREQILQHKVEAMTKKQEEYAEETETLRNHIKLLVKQYDALVINNNELKEDYEKAQREISVLKEQVASLSQQAQRSITTSEMSSERVLLVCTEKDDSGFSLDLASLRAVRTETGMEISQIKDVSPDSLKRAIDRFRSRGSHLYLHLAIRSDEKGYKLGDTIVDATWLSSILDGVIVLVVAGSNSDSIGDFLGVVPYVVTVSGGFKHEDIAIFARIFWIEIGKGIGPSLALKRAMDRSPASIREFVVSHWERI